MRRKKIRVLTKLRGGIAELQVEMGRWKGLRREGRKCAECGSGEVEDVKHYHGDRDTSVSRCTRIYHEMHAIVCP